MEVRLTLNGEPAHVQVADHTTLFALLHDELGATEVKAGCGEGVCGACTVLVNGQAVSSCLVLAAQVRNCDITTVRGVVRTTLGEKLARAFWMHEGAQCGFCTPGLLVMAYTLVRDGEALTEEAIRSGLTGNLCRCTGYVHIVEAILEGGRV
jgi:aerobic-type carbon monoxide dehydrogenase small subunit (CoxS/CutS family)